MVPQYKSTKKNTWLNSTHWNSRSPWHTPSFRESRRPRSSLLTNSGRWPQSWGCWSRGVRWWWYRRINKPWPRLKTQQIHGINVARRSRNLTHILSVNNGMNSSTRKMEPSARDRLRARVVARCISRRYSSLIERTSPCWCNLSITHLTQIISTIKSTRWSSSMSGFRRWNMASIRSSILGLRFCLTQITTLRSTEHITRIGGKLTILRRIMTGYKSFMRVTPKALWNPNESCTTRFILKVMNRVTTTTTIRIIHRDNRLPRPRGGHPQPKRTTLSDCHRRSVHGSRGTPSRSWEKLSRSSIYRIKIRWGRKWLTLSETTIPMINSTPTSLARSPWL